MQLLRFMLRTAPWLTAFAVVSSTLAGLSTTALLAVVNAAISGGAQSRATVIGSFVALIVLSLAFRTMGSLLLAVLGQASLFQLRRDLSRKVLAAPLREMERVGPARILSVLTDDVPALINFVANAPILFMGVALVLASLIYMAVLSWVLLGIVLAFLIVGFASYEYVMRLANRDIVRARELGTVLMEHFRGLLFGMKELKLHRRRRQAFLENQLESTADSYRIHMLHGLRLYSCASAWGELLMFLALGAVLFVSLPGPQPPRSTLSAFVLVLLYAIGPLDAVINLLPQAGRASVALSTIKGLGLDLAEAEENHGGRTLSSTAAAPAEISFVEVGFEYRSNESSEIFELGPISLTVPAGQLVFVIGGNGSGKSTFAKLLTGLYMPDSGLISLGGAPLDENGIEDYRQGFSAVFADFYLFDNLLGLEHPGLDEKAAKYLQRLGLSHKVKIKGGRFSTLDLSQGQRKRLALLTSYLEDRPFYLFDEWAADQDPAFKDVFYYDLLPDLQRSGKTIFVITHDDRYFHLADRLIKFERGKIVSDANRASNVLSAQGSAV